MAELYLAQHAKKGGGFCIKRILPYLASEQEFVQMFLDEARIASQLQHPNIVAVKDLGFIAENIFIVMEFVDGLDLRRICQEEQKKKSVVPYAIAAWMVARVAAGLQYAHDKRWPDGRRIGIIHRDVSPQNVMVSFDGDIKLVDFGIAKATAEMDKTRPGVIKGKFLYLAPEQVTGEKLDSRADLFSLGTLLYEITTGKSPFQRQTAEGVIVAIRSEEPEDPRKVRRDFPRDLSRIISKCLAKDREKRYQQAAEVERDLDAWLAANDPVVAADVAAYLDKLLGGTKGKRTALPPVVAAAQAPAPAAPRAGDETDDMTESDLRSPPRRTTSAPKSRPAAQPAPRPAPTAPPPSLGDDEPEATQMMEAFSGGTQGGDESPYGDTGDLAALEPTPAVRRQPQRTETRNGQQVPWSESAPERGPQDRGQPPRRRPTAVLAAPLPPSEDSAITGQEDEVDRTDPEDTAASRPAAQKGRGALPRARPQKRSSKGALVAGLLGGVLLLALGGGGFLYWQDQQEQAAAEEAAREAAQQLAQQAATPPPPPAPPDPAPPPEPPPPPPPAEVELRVAGPKVAEARWSNKPGEVPGVHAPGTAATVLAGHLEYEFRCNRKTAAWKRAELDVGAPGPVELKLPCPK
ncbi:MAG: hypothetical protein RL653_2179 [Pseudomonadota bacterium]|jgi:serine/threonine-protein kinase